MYVWRLPLFAFAVLSVTAVILPALAVVLWLRRGARSPVRRGLISGLGLVILVAAPILVNLLTRGKLQAAAERGMFVDPSPLVSLLPAVASVFLLAIASHLVPSGSRPGVTYAYRACVIALLFTFGVLNCANWCAPGWCERFGFPFPYSRWSDAIVMMDGVNLSADFSPVAIALNVGVAAAAVAAVAISYRRTEKAT